MEKKATLNEQKVTLEREKKSVEHTLWK